MELSVKYSGLVSINVRDRVLAVERYIEQTEQIGCLVREFRIPGGYAREITIPKGTAITGAIHRKPSVVVLSAGHMKLVTEDGILEIKAPFTMVCSPGAKNLAEALETCVWTNFFVTDETDPDKLIEELTESTRAELLGGKNNKQLLNTRKSSWLLD